LLGSLLAEDGATNTSFEVCLGKNCGHPTLSEKNIFNLFSSLRARRKKFDIAAFSQSFFHPGADS
jgi:hypothetical protein